MRPPKPATLPPRTKKGLLVLDFGLLPPEINSARMYSGPGSGPLMAAAGAWNALSQELSVAATGYSSVVTDMTASPWRGPSSAAMAAAAAPYVAWLHSAAAHAEQAAAQATHAAAAYELAFAMTVPPPVIAANRSLYAALVATNFFGQNTPAVAAAEAHYGQMWLQDAAAMYGYAESSSAATTLTPFSAPPSTTDSAGLGIQSGALAHGASSTATTSPTTLSELIAQMPAALQQLAAPGASAQPLVSAQALVTIGLTPTRFVNMALGPSSAGASGRGISITNQRLASQAERDIEKPLNPAAGLASARPAGSTMAAGLDRASPVGSLSVPPGWVTTAPAIRPVALSLPDPGPGDTAASAADPPAVPGSSFSQGVLGTLSRDVAPTRQPKTRPIIVRSPAAG
jgi:PPE-repeat protein